MYLKKNLRPLKKIIKSVWAWLMLSKIKHSKDTKLVEPVFFDLNSNIFRKDYFYPKVIWMYWHSSEHTPMVVNLCVERVKKYCPDYDVRFLNESNVRDYIEVPELPKDLPIAIKADYIRLKLLAVYGGVWMDSSIFLNDDFSWFTKRLRNHDAFVFFSDESTINFNEPITENWFIVSPAKSPFIEAWLKEFSSCIFSDSPTKYYNDIKRDKEYVQNLPMPDYLLCYISAIKTLKDNRFKVLYVSSASTGHYFNYKHDFNGDYVVAELAMKNENFIPNVKLIKLTSGVRDSLEIILKSGNIKQGSYISNVIKNNHSGIQ